MTSKIFDSIADAILPGRWQREHDRQVENDTAQRCAKSAFEALLKGKEYAHCKGRLTATDKKAIEGFGTKITTEHGVYRNNNKYIIKLPEKNNSETNDNQFRGPMPK